MKAFPALCAVATLAVGGCESLYSPLASSGDFDPLRVPGSNLRPVSANGPTFKAGQFVRAIMDNTAFYKNRLKAEGDADKLLKRDTSMKVISSADTYVKVELDSGEIGFVPAVMVEDPSAANTMPITAPGEYQVYPPLPQTGFGEPLPALDPAGLPPEGAIPTVIDPDAPPVIEPVPSVTPTTDTFPAPVEPKVEPAPLPPNGEE